MTLQEVIEALERVKEEFEKNAKHDDNYTRGYSPREEVKGGYYRVGNVAIKIAEITELK